MGATIEVKYFNSFVLKKSNPSSNIPSWNGSTGVPQPIGGYPRSNTSGINSWAIEEARIRGGYNNTNVDFGVKAYLVEDEPNARVHRRDAKGNGYSGDCEIAHRHRRPG